MDQENQHSKALTNRKSKTISQDSSSKKTELIIPTDGKDDFSKKAFDNPTDLAHNDKDFMVAFYGLLCEVSGQDRQNAFKNRLLQEAMKRKSVTIEEVIEGFWGAYSDPYVKDGNIEWRHIWKHIQQFREQQPQHYTKQDKVYPGN